MKPDNISRSRLRVALYRCDSGAQEEPESGGAIRHLPSFQLHVKSHPDRGQVIGARKLHLIEQVVFIGQITLQFLGQFTAQSPVQVTVHPPSGHEQALLHVQLPAEQVFGGP